MQFYLKDFSISPDNKAKFLLSDSPASQIAVLGFNIVLCHCHRIIVSTTTTTAASKPLRSSAALV